MSFGKKRTRHGIADEFACAAGDPSMRADCRRCAFSKEGASDRPFLVCHDGIGSRRIGVRRIETEQVPHVALLRRAAVFAVRKGADMGTPFA